MDYGRVKMKAERPPYEKPKPKQKLKFDLVKAGDGKHQFKKVAKRNASKPPKKIAALSHAIAKTPGRRRRAVEEHALVMV